LCLSIVLEEFSREDLTITGTSKKRPRDSVMMIDSGCENEEEEDLRLPLHDPADKGDDDEEESYVTQSQTSSRRRGRPKRSASKAAAAQKGRTPGSRNVHFIWDDFALLVRLANQTGGFGLKTKVAFIKTLTARRKTMNKATHLDILPKLPMLFLTLWHWLSDYELLLLLLLFPLA
jgi:hypothetical protein